MLLPPLLLLAAAAAAGAAGAADGVPPSGPTPPALYLAAVLTGVPSRYAVVLWPIPQVVNRYIDQGVAELVPGVLFIDEVRAGFGVGVGWGGRQPWRCGLWGV